MKRVVFYTIMLISMPLQGQLSLRDDTIKIKEVMINGNAFRKPPEGSKMISLDTTEIRSYGSRTLADLISENTSIFIKTYDQGGIATPSLRGTTASHTQVAWNSINLNNPMVGQFDLSLVPAGFVDDVEVYYGGASMNLNNGGIGGIINMETRPEWTGQNVLTINPAIGSFGRYSGMAKAKLVKGRFQSVSKAFVKYSENNFRYLNDVLTARPFWERRTNSQVSQKGFIQELYLKGSGSLVSARVWYQSALRNLPVPMTTQPLNPCETQDDGSLRTMITYDRSKGRAGLNVTAAFLSDKLNYTNKAASVDSKNISRRVILKSDFETSLSEQAKVRLGFSEEMNTINTNNYAESKSRNIAGLYASVENALTSQLVSRILVRETIYNTRILAPDFSLGAEYRILPGKYYFLKASFSKNSRIPSMNEMYWMPGGNPDLKNEAGYSAEATGEGSFTLNTYWQVKSDLTFYRNHVFNMIQWHPGEFAYWEAGNVDELITSGFESNMSLVCTMSKFSAMLNAGFTYTKAMGKSENEGKQLIYIPVNQLNSVLKLSWGSFYSTVFTNFASRRFLTADNSQYLPAYSVSDLRLGIKLASGKALYDMNLLVENLFKANYQSIAYYPMPGRAFLFSVIFQLKK